MSCGIVSAVGVLLIIKDFKHERPIIDEETWGNGKGTPKVEGTEELIEGPVIADE